jgi:hypothetical protein
MRISFTTIFLLLAFALSGQSGKLHQNHECGKANLTLQGMGEANPLYQFLIGEDREGVLKTHPFTLDEAGGWAAFQQALSGNPHIAYEFVSVTKSRLFDGYFVRYQQLYHGIPVVNGGFTILIEPGPGAIPGPPCEGCPPVDPCGLVMMIAPQIYEGLDASVPTTPLIGLTGIASHLPASAIPASVEGELRIVDNIKGDCAYRLAWKLHYADTAQGQRIGWLDAQTGELLYERSLHDSKNAPTADWGVQWMNDSENEGNTVLRNDRLAAYDMTGNLAGDRVFDNNLIPTSPIAQLEWGVGDADPEAFQLFWMSDQAIDEFSNALGIEFANVRVAWHPAEQNAFSFAGGTPGGGADFLFGRFLGASLVEYDIIGHELGHAIIRQFFLSNLAENSSLHEGLADIFGTYIESLLHPAGLDWVIGNHAPLLIRDLENTANNCFANIAGFGINQRHARGEALGHWFFLCVTGDPATGIPPMDIDEAMQVILEALPNLGSNPDYPDLMAATMDIAEHAFGTCSDQFLTILRAWEQICVPTGHRLANPGEPCVFLISSTDMPCEESNVFSVCLSPLAGYDLADGRWTITGRNSVYFQSVAGMQGNSQQGGSCLHVTSIPDMPFYPQAMTIHYWHSGLGQALAQRITIADCDGDDPTCREYYATSLRQQGDEPQLAAGRLSPAGAAQDAAPAEEPLAIIAYDLMGRRLDIDRERLQSSQGGPPRIIVLTYWDKDGNFVKSEKVLIH